MSYKYRLDQCDVEDREKLKKFRRVRTKWMGWLYGPISDHVISMMWSDTIYQTINEARALHFENKTEKVDFNWPVADFIDRAHVTFQLMAVRRLVDRRRDVISLNRLLNDIKKFRPVITREVYVAYDGFPYDYEPVRQRHENQIPDVSDRRVMRELPSEGPEAWQRSNRLHNLFDRLSGVRSDRRKRKDLIHNRVFKDLFSRLSSCSDMEKAATDLLAHIPDPAIRSDWSQTEYKVTLAKIEDAQKAVCQIAALIGGPLLWASSFSSVPTPQFDPLEHFDKPWATTENVGILREFWENRVDAVEKWRQFDWP